ncbi:MAG: YgjP-like metallopeptidase domain-containing protein [Bdellovibrionales bacterium]
MEIVRRPYQRSLSILVKPSGRIRITCARLTTKKTIYKFLSENHEWLRKAIDDQRALRSAHPPKSYRQGEEFLYLGAWVYLNFSPSTQKKITFSIIGDQLVAFIPRDQWTSDYTAKAHPELKELMMQFYKNSGRKTMEMKVKQYSEKMRLFPKKSAIAVKKPGGDHALVEVT